MNELNKKHNLPVSRQEIERWLDNPATIMFLEGVRRRLQKTLDARANGVYYVPFEPFKTSELQAQARGRIDTLGEIFRCIDPDFAEMMVRETDPEEDDE